MKKILNYICITIICVFTIIIPIKVNAEGISLNKSSILLDIGYSETLKYTIDDELNSSDIIWSSSNPSVATVENGKVTAISRGSTIITAIINDKKSTCRVTVSSDYVPVSGINLNESSINILLGTSEKLTATISPNDATNKDIIWTSSEPSVATIDSSGKITAKKLGTTTITATSSSGYKTTCRVTVVETMMLKSISLNKTSLTLKEDSSEVLIVTFNPSNASNKKITWKSSNKNIVTVDSSGKVTGVKAGTATITVVSNDGGYVATCKVTVEEVSKNVTSISLDKKELNMVAGDKETLNVTITPEYAENKKIIWTSSDENIVKVEDGVVTAISAGTAEIKVISEDGNKEDICKVNVTLPPLQGISFSESTQTVYLGSETTLNVITEPTNAVIENPIWTSSDENIATVENGIVKAWAIGESIISVSNQEKTLNASIKVVVINKPEEKINITIEGYDLNFNPDIKKYDLTIGDETELIINTNIDRDKVTINGNQNLKNGSLITITIEDTENVTYIIKIKKKQNYTIYFIITILVLLLINIVRILKNQKPKSSKSKLKS